MKTALTAAYCALRLFNAWPRLQGRLVKASLGRGCDSLDLPAAYDRLMSPRLRRINAMYAKAHKEAL